MKQIKMEKKFFKVLYLIGGEPEINGNEAVCTESDFNDALENLKIHIESPEFFANTAEVMEEIKALGTTPEKLYYNMVEAG